jgi:hypothetical protein
MTEPHRILVGTFPVGASELIGVDEAALKMIAEANRAADLALAEQQRQRQAAIAAPARAEKTRMARRVRRMRKALRQWLF